MLKRQYLKMFLLLVGFGMQCTSLWAGWTQDGTTGLNLDSNKDATYPSIASGGGTLYAAWQEMPGIYQQLYVKRWNGNNWVQDGGGFSLNVDPNQSIAKPSLAVGYSMTLVHGTFHFNYYPTVVWTEGTSSPKIYAKHWNGSSWVQDGGNISTGSWGASNAHLALATSLVGTTPYVVYLETDAGAGPYVYVKHWNGSTWVQDGGALNKDVGYIPTECNIAMNSSTPYVCWVEPNGSNYYLYVKHYDGSSWVQDGTGSLNSSTQRPYAPSIVLSNGTPYVAWQEGNAIYVKHLSGTTWVQDGGNLSDVLNPSMPQIEAAGGTVFVTWRDMVGSMGSAYDIYVKHWDGSTWVQDGRRLNSPNVVAGYPSITMDRGVPRVAYCEQSGTGRYQLYVRHWPFNLFFTPNQGMAGQSLQTTISSSGYIGTPTAKWVRSGSADIGSVATLLNFNQYTFAFDLAGASANGYDLQITLSEGAVGLIPQAVQVVSPLVAPLAWNINPCCTVGSLATVTSACGLVIGDADQDNSQELYAANGDQSIYNVKKGTTAWSATASPVVGSAVFTQLLLADGDGEQMWKVYGASSNSHIYQMKGATLQTTDLAVYNPEGLGLAVMDQDHDGVAEIYAAGSSGQIKQFKYRANDETSWGWGTVPGSPASQCNALAAGNGNNDGKNELYSANADYKIYQYVFTNTYSSSGWHLSGSSAVIGTGTQAMNGVAVGDGDNDGNNHNEVYAACQDGKIYQCVWNSSWTCSPIGAPGNGGMHGIAVGDADNDGKNEVYAACEDGHAYQYKKNGTLWETIDLGRANVPLYALAVGDADNDHKAEVYALGQNNTVYQFKAYTVPATPTPTITPSPTITPTPSPSPTPTITPTDTIYTPTPLPPRTYFKLLNNQISPGHNSQATIRWVQPDAGPVQIIVYNLLGDKVITLSDNQFYTPGEYHDITWDGRNQHGTMVGSGIYVVYFKAQGHKAMGKIAVVK